MKQITLLQDAPIAANGFQVVQYRRGDTVEIPDNIADAMIRDKMAVAGSPKKLPDAAIAPAAERVNLMEVGQEAPTVEQKPKESE